VDFRGGGDRLKSNPFVFVLLKENFHIVQKKNDVKSKSTSIIRNLFLPATIVYTT